MKQIDGRCLTVVSTLVRGSVFLFVQPLALLYPTCRRYKNWQAGKEEPRRPEEQDGHCHSRLDARNKDEL